MDSRLVSLARNSREWQYVKINSTTYRGDCRRTKRRQIHAAQ